MTGKVLRKQQTSCLSWRMICNPRYGDMLPQMFAAVFCSKVVDDSRSMQPLLSFGSNVSNMLFMMLLAADIRQVRRCSQLASSTGGEGPPAVVGFGCAQVCR